MRASRRVEAARSAVLGDRVLHVVAAAGALWTVLYALATALTAGDAAATRILGNVVYLIPIIVATALAVVAARRRSGRSAPVVPVGRVESVVASR